MKATEGQYSIKLNDKECYDIGFWIFLSIEHSVKTHWVNHLNTDWKIQEKERLEKMAQFFVMGLYPDLVNHYIEQLDKIITLAKNNKK